MAITTLQEMQELKNRIRQEYRIMERIPASPKAQSIATGKRIYLDNCVSCHWEKGDEKEPMSSSVKTPPANFLDEDHSGFYSPGEKFWIIGNGTGASGMPGFPHLSHADRWHLVNSILSLQKN